jgi:hypothetical protein
MQCHSDQIVSSKELDQQSETEIRTMAWIVRHMRVLGIGFIFSVLMISHALAQSCTSTADCGGTGICPKGFLFFPRYCVSFACRFNSDCSQISGLPICVQGVCQAPPGHVSPPPSSGGIPLAGTGAACGLITFSGGIKKNIGCQHGLQCRFGHCEKRER